MNLSYKDIIYSYIDNIKNNKSCRNWHMNGQKGAY